MWGWIPFFLMFFMKVAGATPILPRNVTVTRTASFDLSTGFITRTTKGSLKTVTFIAKTAIITTETLDDQGKTITSGPRASKTSAGAGLVVGDPTPNAVATPTPASANDPIVVTMFITLKQSTRYSTLQPSISPSSSALRTNQNIALSTTQTIESVSAASSLSSQDAVQATSKGANEGAEESKPKKFNTTVIIGGIMIGLSITSMLLFAVCLMWRRKQKATLGLYSPTERGYPPAYDARGSAIPFPQSISPSTPDQKQQLTAASATSRSPTVTLSALSSGTPYSHSQPSVSAPSTKHLPFSPFLTPPTPLKDTTHTLLGRSNDLTISRDMILRSPPSPPPGYTA